MSVRPTSVEAPKEPQEPTTDEFLWQQSLLGRTLIEQFQLVLAETSVDCSIHHANLAPDVKSRIHCKTCVATHAKLFHPVVGDDLKYPNPCREPQEKKVKVTKIIVDNESYAYSRNADGIKIYYNDPRVDGYVQMPIDHPMYATIHSQILAAR